MSQLQTVSQPARSRAPGELRRNLSSSVTDAIAYCVMVGVGETYLAAFALALGVSETMAGLIATVPILGGATLQLIVPRLVKRIGSNRRTVVLFSTIQAMSFIPLAIGAFVGRMPVWALFITATVYWGAALACGPPWNTWMESLVPGRIRARYFARRSRLSQVAVFLGLVGAGLLLQFGRETDQILTMFAILFALAAVMRFVSTAFLARQSEDRLDHATTRLVSPLELIKRMAGRADGQLIAYMLAVQVAIQISGPYFTPYMLGRLEFSYRQYLLLLAVSFVAKFLAFPMWGRVAQSLGAQRLLWIGGVGILPMSALWMISPSVPFLVAVQLLSGVVWAAYDLGVFLLIFENIGAKERTSVLTSYNFANALAMVGGSLLGGAILHAMHESTYGYMTLFGLSAVVRLFTLLLLWKVTAESRHPAAMDLRSLAVRPQLGGIERPVFTVLDGDGDGDGEAGGEMAPNGLSHDADETAAPEELQHVVS